VGDLAQRRERASRLLDGYVSGPAAATQATAVALARTADAATIVLVEGVSDQIALETLALRLGRDLPAEHAVVVPIGGAHAVARYARLFGPAGAGARLAGLCDAAEESVYRRGLVLADAGPADTRDALRHLGFFVCDEDLEDELIRAVGVPAVLDLFDEHGDLGPFRSLQAQPAWRGRQVEAQLRRFLSAGARRKLRYARLLTETVTLDRLPAPIAGLLRYV